MDNDNLHNKLVAFVTVCGLILFLGVFFAGVSSRSAIALKQQGGTIQGLSAK